MRKVLLATRSQKPDPNKANEGPSAEALEEARQWLEAMLEHGEPRPAALTRAG